MSGGLLAAVVGAARRSADERARGAAGHEVTRQAAERQPRRAEFEAALAGSGPRIIAECKRRSPSRGVLRPSYDPAAIARAYDAAGAAAISVLTEPTMFDGHLNHLRAARQVSARPLLRKDFIVTEFQIVESREAGADAVLLLASALDDRALASLFDEARAQDLAALVEVHDAGELERALTVGARVVGVNSRDLRTLAVSLAVFDELASRLPPGVIAVAESGLRTPADVRRLYELRYNAFLIGEQFMAATDPGQALSELLAGLDTGAQR